MKKVIILSIITLILGCEKSDYKTVNFEVFEITVPTKWEKFEIDGIDSYVGGLITDYNDTLIFDLGWYSGDLTKNNEVLVYNKSEYSEFTEEQKKQLEKANHLLVEDVSKANYNAKDYLKYEYAIDSIDCFQVKLIRPKNKGFGASGIYIDSLEGSSKNFNKMKFSFYGNNLSDSTQCEFFKALKSIRLIEYCK